MSIEIRQLRCAAMTAEMMSFTQAANKLGIKQSTLSKRVLDLERRLGITLFERSTRGAVPTKAAAEFLARAKRVVSEIDDLQLTARAVRCGESGKLVVGFATSLSTGNLRRIISDFLVRVPEVEFKAIEASSAQLRQGVERQDIDVVIVAANISGDGIQRRPLWGERIMVAMPDDHRLAKSDRIYWTDLRQEVFVLPSQFPGPDMADLLIARLAEPGRRPHIIEQDVSMENILSMASLGKFVTLTSETALGISRPGVILQDIHDLTGQARVDVAAYWRAENDNPALRRFFELIQELYPASGCN
ncbi:MAG: LysR family transcriptional regulator [Sphingomonadaceae bacterium]